MKEKFIFLAPGRSNPSPYVYFALRSRTDFSRLAWLAAIILLEVVFQFLMQAGSAQADAGVLFPFFAYNRQVSSAGELTIIPQNFWWEDRLIPETGKYGAVLTAELHLIGPYLDERVRVEAGRTLVVGDKILQVLKVDGNISQGSYVELRFSNVPGPD
jgi:hypothetical protein